VKKQARITSKGQITVPQEISPRLGRSPRWQAALRERRCGRPGSSCENQEPIWRISRDRDTWDFSRPKGRPPMGSWAARAMITAI